MKCTLPGLGEKVQQIRAFVVFFGKWETIDVNKNVNVPDAMLQLQGSTSLKTLFVSLKSH